MSKIATNTIFYRFWKKMSIAHNQKVAFFGTKQLSKRTFAQYENDKPLQASKSAFFTQICTKCGVLDDFWKNLASPTIKKKAVLSSKGRSKWVFTRLKNGLSQVWKIAFFTSKLPKSYFFQAKDFTSEPSVPPFFWDFQKMSKIFLKELQKWQNLVCPPLSKSENFYSSGGAH